MNSAYFAELRQRVEVDLDRRTAQLDAPEPLLSAMRYSLLAPGKRFRPLLTLLAAAACHGDIEAALPAACALEMVHTYSLIHDDLPAMDDDDLRRGRPTCHKQFDEATAILAGDGLLTLAFEIMAADLRPGSLSAVCCWELARGAGTAGMVGGQMDDITWEGRAGGSVAILEHIHRRKTGALFHAALRIGGRIGLHGQAEETTQALLAALDAFAAPLGLAFQVADDLLDVTSTVEQAGKRTQKDAALGKLTYPGLLGLDATRQLLRDTRAAAAAALAPFGQRAEPLLALLDLVVARDR